MATLTSLGSFSSDAAARTEQQSFSIPLVEALQRGEEQTHVNMDKARSAFERMKNKAAEAQAAKDKEIAELKKVLALAEERIKAAEATAALQLKASQEKEKSLEEQIQSLKEKNAALESREKAIKQDVVDLQKGSGIMNPYIRRNLNYVRAKGCARDIIALDLFFSKMSKEYAFLDYQ